MSLSLQLAFRSGFVLSGMVTAIFCLPSVNAQEQKLLADGFSEFDTDKDGKLSKAEVGYDEIFTAADADQNSFLTSDEVREALSSGKISREAVRQVVANRIRKMVAVPPVAPDPTKTARILRPSDHGVGRYVEDLSFKDLKGKEHRLSSAGDARFTVIAMTSTSCPLSRKYLPTLAELTRLYDGKPVRFILINCIASDAAADMAKAAETLAPNAVYVADQDESFVQHLQALTTTDVLVLDAARTVVYHGAVDDQYGIGYALEQPRRTLLRDALDSVLTGNRPEIVATTAPGCALEPSQPIAGSENITWHNRISRIVQQNCAECHRSEGVGPFPLFSRDEVVAHAAMIRQVVDNGSMPPWFAAKNGAAHSTWGNDRSLSDADRQDLLTWLASDRPEGDPKDAPLPVAHASAWAYGEPDAVVQIPKPISVRASGAMAYQYVRVEWNGTEDKWVRGYEIRPTDRSVVHHVLVTVLEPGADSKRGEEGIGGYWAAYVPGNSGQMYPEGFARRLPAGATIRFQIHYTPNGTATEDQVKLGLYFADKDPKYVVSTIPLAKVNIKIPAQDGNHTETLTRPVQSDIPVMAYMAHMHVRGKAFRFDLNLPDGTKETLLDIPRYDFNWQLRYDYAEPRVLPKGSTVTVTAVYDNSSANPANPDPNQVVTWGEQTFEEMMIGYVETYSAPGAAPPGQRVGGGPGQGELFFSLLDSDRSGKLAREEFQKAAKRFPRLNGREEQLETAFNESDGDQDQQLTVDEFLKVLDRIRRR